MSPSTWAPDRVIAQGAEAVLQSGLWLGQPAVLKIRAPKGYRHPELDERIRASRVRAEARALRDARLAGVRTPAILDLDEQSGAIVLERIEGPTVRAAYDGLPGPDRARVARALGAALGHLHAAGLVHGDPTTSNFIVERLPPEGEPLVAVIDMSMGGRAEGVEERGVDLRLLYEAFGSTHHLHADEFALVLEGYSAACPGVAGGAISRMDAIAARGRYQARGPAAAGGRGREGAADEGAGDGDDAEGEGGEGS
jgi:Kae1-associated kinase Bud32